MLTKLAKQLLNNQEQVPKMETMEMLLTLTDHKAVIKSI